MPDLTLIKVRKHAKAVLLAAFAALFLYQIAAAVHAAKYGDGPHEHHGQECVLSHSAGGGDKAIANSALMIFIAAVVWRSGAQAAQTDRALVAVRAARPRGPPLR